VKRRAVISLSIGCAVSVALPAKAQAQRVMRLGNLGNFPLLTEEQFGQAMRQRGWEVGRNLLVERRFAMGDPRRYSVLAHELVAARVDVITADGDLAAMVTWGQVLRRASGPAHLHACGPSSFFCSSRGPVRRLYWQEISN